MNLQFISCSCLSNKHEGRANPIFENNTSNRFPMVVPGIMDGHIGVVDGLCRSSTYAQLLFGHNDRRHGPNVDIG